MKLRKNKKGFTLVELLVVIAIIGILAVVAVPALFSNINKAKVASVESDYSSVKSAALSLYSDTNKLPADENLDSLEGYMETIPTKPDVGESYKLKTTGNKLGLEVEKATLTKAQIDKLISDIGENKIYTDGDFKKGLTEEQRKGIKETTIYLILIENTDL
ncbi:MULTISPECIES: prepilin-type N-terminal cleavage/methylation domain-containing protein [unclassified Clostridioides]|uniref:type II secretion system protein n=1 Tax=unclassified Clostridioides TaxID=2635829 RepID=UPI001D0FE16A|nr:prepilin-type N-terminal cleavage/methylation domain-containing protein [Clostridioides sp. ZZV14-6105]MCC0743408.1 prepilin-type N-terminal cleavage/methylation domain-containing protein [Clostridioides sp. ZZV14-6044]MCC0751591.1 prepilin-type N-terminal cleavage/methylation domain-containing protein [Clostridioides sp. ZZV13-5731]